MQSLPMTTMLGSTSKLIMYENFWYVINPSLFRNVLSIQKHFVVKDKDIFIAGLPKTGTTWLKSLLFATVDRTNHPIDKSLLLTHHPQELVYNLESDVYNEAFVYPRPNNLNELPSPRLLSTHISYTSLPKSIKTFGCRILYICRNPVDMFVKKREINEYDQDSLTLPRLEDFFEDFCEGKVIFGPFFEHALEYWKISLEQPYKVLFLKYEDLKDYPSNHLKRLAEFIGMPFSPQEESEGVIQEIVEFCSIKNMKELDVNKNGVINNFFEKKSYFRKGEVGDWANHVKPSMVERIHKLMQEKLEGSGLSFKVLP
ncbi:Cytosolic sulfotransferase 8 [Bienertia sinuspersici]